MTSPYRVEISRTAERQLKTVAREHQVRLAKSMRGPALEPRPHGSHQLHGYEDVYRIRVGPYRIIYSVDERVVVIILKIGHRREVHR